MSDAKKLDLTVHADACGAKFNTMAPCTCGAVVCASPAITPEVDRMLRQFLWLNHGHTGQYGDDGEMQCAMCMAFGTYDYRRASFEDLFRTIEGHGIAVLAHMVTPQQLEERILKERVDNLFTRIFRGDTGRHAACGKFSEMVFRQADNAVVKLLLDSDATVLQRRQVEALEKIAEALTGGSQWAKSLKEIAEALFVSPESHSPSLLDSLEAISTRI